MELRIIIGCISIISMIFLCSCQSSPSESEVVFKNNGAFDSNIVQSIENTTPPEETISINYKDSFRSSDGSVDFSFHIQEHIPAGNMPVVEVAPHFLTGADAKHVAEILFKEAEIYEAQPSFATTYSKGEIQEKLIRWSQYTSEAAIEELFGSPQINASNVIKDYIERYTQLMVTAPEVVPKTPCLWQYQESWKYSYTDEQVKSENISISKDDEIRAYVYSTDIPYRYSVSTRNKSDYKYNMIFAIPDYGISPWSLDEVILQADLCRGKKPKDEQIIYAKNKASELLNNMNLGEWTIDTCEVQQFAYGEVIDYKICVKATPVFNGAITIRMPQLSNLKSDAAYASNYYLTDAEFQFSPEGKLLYFQLFSPVDLVRVVTEQPKTLCIDELIEISKNYFFLSDACSYGIGGNLGEINRNYDCAVTINNLKYGLTRVKVPNTDDRYYYIPSIVLSGDIEYSTSNTGELCFHNEDVTLLHLNAIDGSLLPLDNG